MPAQYSATVTVQRPAGNELFRGKAYYRLRFEVISSVGVPLELFVHQQHGSNSPVRDDFIAVAGPLDLVNLQVGATSIDGYHRLAYADLAMESIQFATATTRVIKESLQRLMDGLVQLDNLVLADTFEVENS